MSVLIVIPARYASSRFPGKPLAMLRGADGTSKSLIERSWRAAQSVAGVARVVVATDDARIEDAAHAFGAEVVMTSPDCANGTERCAEALRSVGEDYEIVVNLQGDAPLTPHWFVEDLVAGMHSDPQADVATPVLRCDGRALNGFLQDRANGRVGGTTAVFSRSRHALYFSKEVIPYTSDVYDDGGIPRSFTMWGLCLQTRGAARLRRLVGRSSGTAGRPGTASVSRERARYPVRRGRGARTAILGTQQPGRY